MKVMLLTFLKLACPAEVVGRTPWSRSRNDGVSILQGTSGPTGASAADQGVRPTITPPGATHDRRTF